MSVPASTHKQLPAWPHRLVGLLLLAAFCMAGLATAQASAKYDPYSHSISLNHTITVGHATDPVHLWDADSGVPAQVQIERTYRALLFSIAPTSFYPQPLTGFTARAPPASTPHFQIIVC